MKVKGLRWWVLSLVVTITIINYLDRGTLTYMWAPDQKTVFALREKDEKTTPLPYCHRTNGTLELHFPDGTEKKVPEKDAAIDMANHQATYSQKDPRGIAATLGLLDLTASKKEIDDRSKKLYSYIYIFFMVAYGVSQLLSGKLYDRIGTRKGFMFSAITWGSADMLTSLASGLSPLIGFRVLLGLGEAGPWPGAVKSNAEWFPVRERALAQGLFGAGGSVGNILAPIVISMLFLALGWRNTFVVVGSLGILWCIPWMIVNKKGPSEHPWITGEEQEHILSGRPLASASTEKGKSWGELLKEKKSYALILSRFFFDPVWWMFVAWLPNYLGSKFNLDIKQVAFSAWVPYVGAAVGAIAGGAYSGGLIKKGKTSIAARKRAVLIGTAVALPAMIAAAFAATSGLAVCLMAFLLGGFQFAIVNIQTLPSDFHSGKTVGSLAGLGGIAAVAGTVATMFLVPYITAGNNWLPFFAMGAALVPLTLVSMFYFSPKK